MLYQKVHMLLAQGYYCATVTTYVPVDILED